MLDRLKEKEILSDIKLGRSEAWVALFDSYSLKLWQRIRVFFENDQYANEITREVFLRAAIQTKRLSGKKRLWPWLWNIASECIKREYDRKFRQDRLSVALESLRLGDLFSRSHLLEKITKDSDVNNLVILFRTVIAKLEPMHQSVLIAKYVNRQTSRQISKEVMLSGEKFRAKIEKAVLDIQTRLQEIISSAAEWKVECEISGEFCEDLFSLLTKVEQPSDDLFFDLVRNESLKAFVSGESGIEVFETEKMNMLKPALLAVLIIVFVSTIFYMIKQTEQRRLIINEKLVTNHAEEIQNDSSVLPPEIEEKLDIEKQTDDLNQDKDQQIKTGVDKTYEQAKALAEAGDVNGLIEMLDSAGTVEKMLAARFLADFGNEDAIEPLEREAKQWIGDAESNIFAAAAQMIRKRLKAEGGKPGEVVDDKSASKEIFEVAGVILDANMQPLQNVIISSMIIKSDDYKELLDMADQGYPVRADLLINEKKKKVSDVEGKFVLEDLSDFKEKDYLRFIVFEHPDHAISWYRLEDVEDGELMVQLPDRSIISGVVRDGRGEAIKDAEITLLIGFEDEDDYFVFNKQNKLSVKTDTEGFFEFNNIPVESYVIVYVEHPDYISKALGNPRGGFRFPAGTSDIPVILEAGLEFQFQLSDIGGQPVKGRILLSTLNEIETDDEGRAEFVLDRTAAYICCAEAANGRSALSFVFEPEGYREGEIVEIELIETLSINAEVVDRERIPVDDFKVRLIFKFEDKIFPAKWGSWVSDISQDGTLEMRAVPAGLDFEVYIEGPETSQSVLVENALAGERIDLGTVILP